MLLLVDYLKFHKINNPVFIIGNSAKSYFNELDKEKFNKRQLVFLQYLSPNSPFEKYIEHEESQDYLHIDINDLEDVEYSKEGINQSLFSLFETDKLFMSLNEVTIITGLDELLSQCFIDLMIEKQSLMGFNVNLFVKKPKISFKNIKEEVEIYFSKCLSHFKVVFNIADARTQLYTILNN